MRTQSPTHTYSVGELVILDFDDRQFFSKLNPFTVEARLPPVGTTLQYRLKSGLETCRRVVPEHRLRALADADASISLDHAALRDDAVG